MKWDIIKSTWEYREPTLLCRLTHHLFFWDDWKTGLYFPDEKNCICERCHTWWATGLNRHERSFPPMFIGQDPITQKGIVNEPFWYIEGEAGIKKNPIYTDDGRWLNGKGVALKRERYPDD